MFGGGRKIECKVDKKSAFLPCFHLFLLSPSQPHLRPPPLSPPSFPLHSISQPDTQQPHVVAAPPFSLSLSLSLSLFCETFFPLYHCDPSSSSNHPFQRLPPLPGAVEVTTLSSSTPTATAAPTATTAAPATRAAVTPVAQPSPLPPLTPRRPTRSDHLMPGNFPLPLPPPFLLLLFLLLLLLHAVHCINSRREL